MNSFTDIPEIQVHARPRSEEPLDPLAPTLMLHLALDTPIYRVTIKTPHHVSISAVWINDEDEARRILQDKEKIWKKGPQTYEPFSSLVPRHLISLEGEYHLKMRSKAQAALADAIAERRIPAEEVANSVIRAIEYAETNPTWMGSMRNVGGKRVFVTTQMDKIIRAAALDIVSSALFGRRWNVVEDYTKTNSKAHALAGVMNELHWRVTDFTYTEWRRDPRAGPAGNLLDILDKFVLDEIEKSKSRVEKTSEDGCMLDSWMRDKDLSCEEVRNLAMTFLTMGSENVSTGLAWCAICLSENPTAQEEARLSKEALTVAFHEAIRLYPSVSVLTRMPIVNTSVCGYEIPRFTEVIVNMYAIHRNQKTWGEDSLEFNPRRCPVVSTQGPPNAFPFGAGARSCIGRPLTMHELHHVLLPVLQTFKLFSVGPPSSPTSHDEYEIDPQAKTTPNNFVSFRPGLHSVAFVHLNNNNKTMTSSL